MPTQSNRITTQSTLAPAFKMWESYLMDQGRSHYTVKAFMSDIRILTKFFAEDKTIGSFTTAELNQYLHWMEHDRGIPCSPKTLARRITSLKSFFQWLHKFGVLTLDPAEKIIQRSVLSPLPQVLSPAEVEAVMLAADRHRRKEKADARSYTLLYLLLTTGIKKSECLGIMLSHIELKAKNGPQVFIKYPTPVNRYKERKLPLVDDWIPAFQEYKTQYDISDQLFPWSPRRLEYLLEDIGEEAGLDKHLSFDMCRWTYAVTEFRNGMENDKIRENLGVSKIQWREINMKLRQLAGNKK